MFRRKKPMHLTYDKALWEPVIRCSICTGEQVAGFRNLDTGKFREDRLLKTQADLQAFLEEYDIQVPPRHIY